MSKNLCITFLALVALAACNSNHCEGGSVCSIVDGPSPAKPTATATPKGSATPTPSATPKNVCSFDDMTVGWKGGAQIPVLVEDEELDVTPTQDGNEVDKGCNTKRRPTYTVLSRGVCGIFANPGTKEIDYNPILRPLPGTAGRLCEVSVSMVDAFTGKTVTAQPFSVPVG